MLKLLRTLTLFMHPLKSHNVFILGRLKLLGFSGHKSSSNKV